MRRRPSSLHQLFRVLADREEYRAMGMKLKVYAGAEHPHAAQQPREIKMEDN